MDLSFDSCELCPGAVDPNAPVDPNTNPNDPNNPNSPNGEPSESNIIKFGGLIVLLAYLII